MKKLFVFGLLFLGSCSEPMKNKVEDAMKQYDKHVENMDAKSVAGMFTQDGEIASANGQSIKGRNNIENYMLTFTGIKIQQQNNTTDSIKTLGDTVIQYGKYTQQALIGGKKALVHGTYEANWVLQADGSVLMNRISSTPTMNK